MFFHVGGELLGRSLPYELVPVRLKDDCSVHDRDLLTKGIRVPRRNCVLVFVGNDVPSSKVVLVGVFRAGQGPITRRVR